MGISTIPFDIRVNNQITMTFHTIDEKEGSAVSHQTDTYIANVTSRPSGAVGTKTHTATVPIIMFSCGVFGNILALVALAKSKKEQKQTIFYKLAASLVVTDLLGTIATSPVVIATYENNFKMPCQPILCLYFAFMMVLAGFATQFIILTMAIERYFCINQPCYYYTQPMRGYTRIALLLCWAGSISIASLPFMGVGSYKLMRPGTWCFFDYYSSVETDVIFSFIYSLLGIITIMSTVILNIVVLRKLIHVRCRQTVIRSGSGRLRRLGNNRRYTEVQMVLQLISITCIFTTCYLPLMLQIFMNQFTDMSDHGLVVIRLASLNQILDPWVYILIRRNTVYHVSRVFRWVFRLKRPSFLDRSPSLTLRRPSSESKGSVGKMASLDSRKMSFGSLNNNANKDDIGWAEFCWNCMCENPADKYDYNNALNSSRSDISKHQVSVLIKSPAQNGEIARM